MQAFCVFPGRVPDVDASQATDSRDVSLTIPARPDYLVLARLALSAVCRLTPLSPEEVADLKLAITEAANDYVDESVGLEDESRAIIEATVDEAEFAAGRTRLIKYLSETG